MAIGSQFGTLIDMLKNELGRSTNVGVGVDDRPQLMHHINRAYAILAETYEWDHLRHLPARISLAAGQRLYDFPSTLKLDGLARVTCWQGTLPIPLERGISDAEYAVFDSENDVRSDPAQKWDLRYNGTVTQIEVWPIPASNDLTLELTGRYVTPKLVNDSDLCRLDDYLVVLAAAARLLARQKSDDAAIVRDEFNAYLGKLRANSGPGATVTMGGAGEPRVRKPTVSVAGR